MTETVAGELAIGPAQSRVHGLERALEAQIFTDPIIGAEKGSLGSPGSDGHFVFGGLKEAARISSLGER
jgi:hypothetical protein